MSARPPPPVYVARETYRRRRLADAARLLPFLGLALFLLPLLFDGAPGTLGVAIWVFSVWLVLIVAAFVLSRLLMRPMARDEPPDPDET